MNLECSTREISATSREYLGGILVGEWNGVVANVEFGGIENDERGGGDDVEVDGDGTCKTVRDEVGLEPNVIAFRNDEFRKARLSFELIHLFIVFAQIHTERNKLRVKSEVGWVFTTIYRDCSSSVDPHYHLVWIIGKIVKDVK